MMYLSDIISKDSKYIGKFISETGFYMYDKRTYKLYNFLRIFFVFEIIFFILLGILKYNNLDNKSSPILIFILLTITLMLHGYIRYNKILIQVEQIILPNDVEYGFSMDKVYSVVVRTQNKKYLVRFENTNCYRIDLDRFFDYSIEETKIQNMSISDVKEFLEEDIYKTKRYITNLAKCLDIERMKIKFKTKPY